MIEFNNKYHGSVIAKEARCLFNSSSDVVISRSSGGVLLGGMIFYDYTESTICVHLAGFRPNWINVDLLWVAFSYPFEQLGCHSMFAELRSNNMKALDFSMKMGFKGEVTIPGVYPDADLVVLRMKRDDCRWLNIKPRSISYGREKQSASAA